MLPCQRDSRTFSHTASTRERFLALIQRQSALVHENRHWNTSQVRLKKDTFQVLPETPRTGGSGEEFKISTGTTGYNQPNISLHQHLRLTTPRAGRCALSLPEFQPLEIKPSVRGGRLQTTERMASSSFSVQKGSTSPAVWPSTLRLFCTLQRGCKERKPPRLPPAALCSATCSHTECVHARVPPVSRSLVLTPRS